MTCVEKTVGTWATGSSLWQRPSTRYMSIAAYAILAVNWSRLVSPSLKSPRMMHNAFHKITAFLAPHWQFLKWGVSIGLLAWLVTSMPMAQWLFLWQRMSLPWLLAAMGVFFVAQLIAAWRWHTLCHQLGLRPSYWRLLQLGFVGLYFNLFLPGAVGGDALRGIFLHQRLKIKALIPIPSETTPDVAADTDVMTTDRVVMPSRRAIVLSILADRGSGLLLLLVMTGLLYIVPVTSVPVPHAIRVGFMASAIAVVGAYSALVLATKWGQRNPSFSWLFWPSQPPKLAKWAHALKEILRLTHALWRPSRSTLASMLGALGCQLGMIGVHVCLAKAFGLPVSVAFLTTVYGVVTLLSMLPLSLNGMGVREAGYQWLFAQADLAASSGLALGLSWFMVSAVWSLVGGLVYQISGFTRAGQETLHKPSQPLAMA